MAYGTSDTHKQLKNDMPKSLVGLYASINQHLLDTFTALVQNQILFGAYSGLGYPET